MPRLETSPPASDEDSPRIRGEPNRSTRWPSVSQAGRGRRLTGASFASQSKYSGSPISPGSDNNVGIIPVVLSPPPMSSSPPAAPMAKPHIATLQVPRRPRGHFREADVDAYNPPPVPPMPFSPESPSAPGAKWSSVRHFRASLKPSKRLPPPLPSPSVYDGDFPDGNAPHEEEKRERSAKRKTLFQRAIEGWWDLPGLLGRSDTLKSKTRPSRKESREPTNFV